MVPVTATMSSVTETDCIDLQAAMGFVGHRWAGPILMALAAGAVRFTEVQRMVDGVSGRLLSARLKELESVGLVRRDVVPTTPAHAEYRLTERGGSLIVALRPLAHWAAEHGRLVPTT